MARAGLQPARRPSVSVIVALLLALDVHAVVTWTKNQPGNHQDPKDHKGHIPDHIVATNPKVANGTVPKKVEIPEGTQGLPLQEAGAKPMKTITNWLAGKQGGIDNPVLKDDKDLVKKEQEAEGALKNVTEATAKAETEFQESKTKEEEAKRELVRSSTDAEMLKKEANEARAKADAAKKVAADLKTEVGKAEKKEGTLDEKVDDDKKAVENADDKVENTGDIKGNKTAEDFGTAIEKMDAVDVKQTAEQKQYDHQDAAEQAHKSAEELRAQAKLAEEEADRLVKLATEAEKKAKEAEGQVENDQTIVSAKEKRTAESKKKVDSLTLLKQEPIKWSGAEDLLKYKDEETGGLIVFTEMEGTGLKHDKWQARAADWAAKNKEWWPTSSRPRCCKWKDSGTEVRSDFNVCPVDGRKGQEELEASYLCEKAAALQPEGEKVGFFDAVKGAAKTAVETTKDVATGNLSFEDSDEAAEREDEAAETPQDGKRVSPLVLRDKHGKRVLISTKNCAEFNKNRGVVQKGHDGDSQRAQAHGIANSPLTHVADTVDFLCQHFPAVSMTMKLLGCCLKPPPESAAKDPATEGADEKKETNTAKRRVRTAIRAAGRVALHRFKRRVRRFLRGMMH